MARYSLIKVLWSAGLACCILAPARSQAPPATADTILSRSQLESDPALRAPISHEAEAQPLSEFLGELTRQSGVAFEIEAAPDVRVTAHLEALALGEVLHAVSGLYGVNWRKNGAKIRLLAAEPLQAQALQLGDPDWFEFWKGVRAASAPPHLKSSSGIDWFEEARNLSDDETLRVRREAKVATEIVNSDNGARSTARTYFSVERGGLRFTELPTDLQTRLKEQVQRSVGLRNMRIYLKRTQNVAEIEALAAGNGVLKMRPVEGGGTLIRERRGQREVIRETPRPGIVLMSSSGRLLLALPFEPLKSAFGKPEEWQSETPVAATNGAQSPAPQGAP